MEFDQSNFEDSKQLVDPLRSNLQIDCFDHLRYLYPNGHKVTPQMRWFKLSKGKGSSSGISYKN